MSSYLGWLDEPENIFVDLSAVQFQFLQLLHHMFFCHGKQARKTKSVGEFDQLDAVDGVEVAAPPRVEKLLQCRERLQTDAGERDLGTNTQTSGTTAPHHCIYR